MATNAPPSPAQLQALNDQQSALLIGQSQPVTMPIFSKNIDPTVQNGSIDVTLKNVGYLRRCIVHASGNLINTDGAVDATASPVGLSNLFSTVSFFDLQNYERIKTGGWHLTLLETVKKQWPNKSALQASVWNPGGAAPQQRSNTMGFGANYPAIQAPLTVVHGGGATPFSMWWEVPVCYSDTDTRGGIDLNAIQANAQLSLTINPFPFVATGADDSFAVYSGGTMAFSGVINVTVYQEHWDQIPTDPASGQRVIPLIDSVTVYEIKNTRKTAISAGQDNPFSYGSFRKWLSVLAFYNHDGTSAGHVGGSDINKWLLQSANSLKLRDEDPLLTALKAREVVGTDLPTGWYYFSHRTRPIEISVTGNMQLVLNPSVAGAGAYVQLGYEAMIIQAALNQAGPISQ